MNKTQKKAFGLIFLFGIISLLGDISYEGARSIHGAYLEQLQTNAILVGWIMGVGEFSSYLIRIFSGYFSDKTKAPWFFTILGYTLIVSMPMLSFVETWEFVAILILVERIGKGIRSPAKDTIISFATKQVGTGFGFGILEFLDQFGAFLGPMIFTLFFLSKKTEAKVTEYQQAYSMLWIPFFVLMVFLFFTYFKFKNPEELEIKKQKNSLSISYPFWLYSLFVFFTTIGFINFGIIGFHLKSKGMVTDAQIPFLYAIAMLVDALTGIFFGKYYDHLKEQKKVSPLTILFFIPILTIFSTFFVFRNEWYFLLFGSILWGMVMGLHETILKAIIADISSIEKRGITFGLFHMIYGTAIFFGSITVGYLYEISIYAVFLSVFFIEILSFMIGIQLKRTFKNMEIL
ncbi:MAG: MFS transporter [Leptonema sp. (in: bacteria)]